jgi:GntR family transcriptional regulator
MARTPLYKAAETEMIRRIEAGEWEVGKRLPNEFVLAEEFKVSQGTMRRALMTLEGMGLLNRKPGRGTLVARPAVRDGQAVAVRLLSDGAPVTFRGAPGEIRPARRRCREAALFGTGRLSHVERLLKRGGARAGTEDIAIPESVAPALDEDAPLDFAEFLAAHGLQAPYHRTRQRRHHVTMTESVALSCDRHTPLLVVTRTAYDDAGARSRDRSCA